MGYTTEFEGRFGLDHELTSAHAAYLRQFAETRRMRRNASVAEALPDPLRLAVGLPVGEEGEYFVGGGGDFGQDHDSSIIDYNQEPVSQPGLWCQWVPTEDYGGIEWNGSEKFYSYVDWLQYLIDHFLKRWGYTMNGVVFWSGEDRKDIGFIEVVDNTISVHEGAVQLPERAPTAPPLPDAPIPNGVVVNFVLTDEVRGSGRICGIAANGVAVLGRTYIVEYTELSVPHPYPCIPVLASQIHEVVLAKSNGLVTP